VTVEELARRLDEPDLVLIDVRSSVEFSGESGYPCDPRQGHLPGARNVPLDVVFSVPGDELEGVIGAPKGAEVIVYCHSGSRSSIAATALLRAGYRARNYVGSWHEWSRREDLPAS
jgi:thiosulfate/3-mercaptopyruvate sulfurtransferase